MAKSWLVLASLYFYGYFNISYLPIILSSILVNYLVGLGLHRSDLNDLIRRIILSIGIIFNVGLIGYFKYRDFFIENINEVFSSNIPLLNILLPLGISFFTFQQISFIVDCYRRTSLKYDFLSYCLFVTFFPQLIAGPIVLATEMLPQFEDAEKKRINYENLNKGLFIFAIGLFKKVILADDIAGGANAGFDSTQPLTCMAAWLSSMCYTLQLYFDFSGYCDMAMGIGLMFNIKLPLNFNSPYKALNFQDFWKRWHMTLGRFLSTYLYIPLGGNRKGTSRTLINLIIVFLVSGIWHGAGWGFILWGALHGLGILIHRVWKNAGLHMPALLGWAITLFFVNILWIFFRAEQLSTALGMIESMFDFDSLNKGLGSLFIGCLQTTEIKRALILGIIIAFFLPNSYTLLNKFRPNFITGLHLLICLLLGIIFITKESTFLYWNF